MPGDIVTNVSIAFETLLRRFASIDSMDLVRRLHATSLPAICLLSLAINAEAQSLADADAFEGKTVISIGFEPAAQPLEKAVADSLIPIKTDQPFHAAEARAAIENLFSTGRFEDIQLDAEPSGSGVALRFVTKNSWFFGHIDIETDVSEPPNEGQILSVTGITLGAPFDPAVVTDAEEKIRTLLVNNGYFHPSVVHEFKYEPVFQEVFITFTIKATRRAHYTTPVISGDTSVLDATTIEKSTKWHRFLMPGYRGITQTRTRVGIDNIRLRYQKSDRLMAIVTFSGIDPTNEDKRTPSGTPHISVEPGPVVEVKATGAKVSRKTLTQVLPIYEEGTVDADLLAEGAQNLRNYFQVRGYFEVAVDFNQQKVQDGKTVIEYAVQTGERHRLIDVEIHGNKYFDEKTIRERMSLLPKSFEFRRGRYSEAMAAADKSSIEELYRSNGFRDVHVNSETRDDYKNVKGDIATFFTIEEGSQYRVTSLTISGTKKLDLGNLRDQLSSQEGQAFSEFNIAADRDTILSKYGAAGFSDTTFEWSWDPAKDPFTVNLKFTIFEGDPQFVRGVVVSGLSTTRKSLVDEQVYLRPDDPLSASSMAETQRRLYDLGIFSQVNMAVQNPDGMEDRRFVIFDFQEASRYSLTAGAGMEFGRIGGGTAVSDLSNPSGSATLSPHVSMSLTRSNLFGLGQSVSLTGRFSSLQKRGTFSYFVPRIFSKRTLDGTFSLVYDDTNDVNTFHSVREEISAQITQKYTKALTFFYRFAYRDVNVSDLKISPLLAPRLAETVRTGIASFNLAHDRRDDPTDPHRGIYSTLDVGLASKAFGSENDFVRVLGRNATYYRIGSKIVLARETQFGVEPAYHISPTADPTDPIPLSERFYGGGSSTHRGFPQNQAGPRDSYTGFPLGGSALFFNSTEVRFPLIGANISGVVFEDMGNIYSSIGSMSFRVTQRDLTDFNYMVHALGFGVRYRTPIGPLRFDLAYSLNPPRYNGFSGSYAELVDCSASGTCIPSTQRISHFQFFFSIGQAF